VTTGTVHIAPGGPDSRHFLMVGGASEQAYLNALGRRLGDLTAQRRAFYSAAHELAHHVVVLDGLDEMNNTGMASAINAIDLARGLLQPADAGWITFTGRNAAALFFVATPKYTGGAVPRLPTWATRDVAGTVSDMWSGSSAIEAAYPAHMEQQITFRLSVLASVRDALLRLIDTLISMARLWAMKIWLVHRERSHVVARVLARITGCLPVIRAFALVIVAVCRRYGHRSEPGDHASLLIRRHLVSMGSDPPN